jgi:hypothetical protein
MGDMNLEKNKFPARGVMLRVRAEPISSLEQVANTLSGAVIQAASALDFVGNKIAEAATAVYGLLQDMWKEVEPALQGFASDVNSVAGAIQKTKSYSAVAGFVSRHKYVLGMGVGLSVAIPVRFAFDSAVEYVATKLFEICREGQKAMLFSAIDTSYITDEMLFEAMKMEFASNMKIVLGIAASIAGAAVAVAGIMEIMGKTDREIYRAI